MSQKLRINLSHTYMDLPNEMYSLVKENNIESSEIVLLNKELAKELDVDHAFLESEKGVQLLSGRTSEFGPLYAQAYGGHQYGHFTMLGDGRAMNLGELKSKEGRLFDLQLKGSGRTPYSRRGDGKATLYSMLREYLISEAMNALRIPTTRALSVVKTNEKIPRITLKEAGILCRVASSHIRVGTFEYAKAKGGKKLVKELADYTIENYFNDLSQTKNKYASFLGEVIQRQAILIAKWQSVGFVHGVMNTDNMSVTGDTIDYGPCAFMNAYDPKTVFSSIDSNGRYAYGKQPYIGSWNLARFAETLLELLSDDVEESVAIANAELNKYEKIFTSTWYETMANKLGIVDPIDEEKQLIDELLNMMEKYQADYTNTFRFITLDEYSQLPFYGTELWNEWFQKWTRSLGVRQMDVQKRIALMEKSNPYIIPRNLLVEDALLKASENDDYTLFHELLSNLKEPYNYRLNYKKEMLNPRETKEKYVTYCGT